MSEVCSESIRSGRKCETRWTDISSCRKQEFEWGTSF